MWSYTRSSYGFFASCRYCVYRQWCSFCSTFDMLLNIGAATLWATALYLAVQGGIGDVSCGVQFFQAAVYEVGLVLRSARFGLPVRRRSVHFQRVTFSDPELAPVGFKKVAARENIVKGWKWYVFLFLQMLAPLLRSKLKPWSSCKWCAGALSVCPLSDEVRANLSLFGHLSFRNA